LVPVVAIEEQKLDSCFRRNDKEEIAALALAMT
jgi:hypothetical protein